MELEDPARLKDLMGWLGDPANRTRIDAALQALDYVHFARFLPIWEHGLLLIVTEYDGNVRDYVMDFAATLDLEFSTILSYMKDRPRLPVGRYPAEFWAYVQRNTRPHAPYLPAHADPFSPYERQTVLDILPADRAKRLPPRPALDSAPLQLEDVQANLLRGFRAERVLHVGLRFGDPRDAAGFVAALATKVTPARPWNVRHLHVTTLAFTHEGLRALQLPEPLLQPFPEAFRGGAAARAADLGESGSAAPAQWRIGRPDANGDSGVHALVSIYAKRDTQPGGPDAATTLTAQADALAALRERFGIDEVFAESAAAMPGNRVHFGYRDGIGQPRIDGVHDGAPQAERPGAQPLSPPGDFVLGTGYPNSRGGFYLGELAPALAQNGTYAALRMIEQDVEAFDALLNRVQAQHGLDPELTAAKLMGRWRNGSPVSQWPRQPSPHADHERDPALDSFDYDHPDDALPGAADAPPAEVTAGASTPPALPVRDRLGARCPIGSHIRRLHPRSGLVLGVPWGRRLIRRGLPYERTLDDGRVEKGLLGLFFCGDLEQQFEFVLRVWAQEGFSAVGLRGTQDPFVGTREGSTPFSFRPSETAEPITIEVPRLTRTVGGLYLFYPGLSALRWIGARGWSAAAAPLRPVAALPPAPRLPPDEFNPFDPAFRVRPYAAYAALRRRAPVARVDWTNSVWVTSSALVREINERSDVFLKPGGGRDPIGRPFDIVATFADGLFFADPPRHTAMRAMLDADFGAAIARIAGFARGQADALLRDALRPDARSERAPFDLVAAFAAPLPMRVFMALMGVPASDQAIVDTWTRALLAAHAPAAPPAQRLFGATAGLALRTYFQALAKDGPVARTPWDTPTLMQALAARSGSALTAGRLDPEEITATALHFALGGYLSTEFLLATGVRHLLTGGADDGAPADPAAWRLLGGDRALLTQAIAEAIRFDAPFQMADRWVADDTELGGVRITAGSKVVAVYGAANRDPDRDGRHDARADTFDIRRPPAAHFGFGGGPHRCIGAPLALTVVQAALSALLDACPGATLVEAGQWSADPYFRTLDRLVLDPG